MTVVFQRPYQFIPPARSNFWPWFVQTFRVVEWHLRRKEGVVSHECRHLDRLTQSIADDDGILLAPNHCRYADPLAMGWPSRESGRHVFAMASWHLFNDSWLDGFAIQKMGGFSINREAADRQSLETAIDILVDAKRPLIIFPEGTTNRTNDVLKPLLDGVAFVARAAARKRAKKSGGRVVIQPVAIKYLCVDDDITAWVDRQLCQLEKRIGWVRPSDQSLLGRLVRVAEAMLSLREIQYLGNSQSGELSARRDHLIAELLKKSEQRLGLSPESDEPRSRVRSIRSEVVRRYFGLKPDELETIRLRNDVVAADLAQELLSYPDCYLQPDQVTDTRVVETIQRMQETLLGKADVSVPLHAVIEIDQPIEVSSAKPTKGQAEPLMEELAARLSVMLDRLSAEARPFRS